MAGSVAVLLGVAPAVAAEWYAGPRPGPGGYGTRTDPWDLESTLAGRRLVAPGDTLWVLPGTYRYIDRTVGAVGFPVELAGRKDRPIVVRALPGARATIDGGLNIRGPASWLTIADLEIVVSENFSMPRRVDEPGSHPISYARPWGGLNAYVGQGCKYVNLVIHDNAQGVSFWHGATDSELYGCLIYDNGWDAPDRGHGHAIYTQNEKGLKTIVDCIITGGHSFSLHAYGSAHAYVDHYLVQGNIIYRAGQFLIGGGRPSRDIRVLDNLLYDSNMRLGYSAPQNEDCELRGNVLVNSPLRIENFRRFVNQDNLVLDAQASRPDEPARVILRPNRYDPLRANLAIFNWTKQCTAEVHLEPFLKPGQTFRLLDPRNFYGRPVFQSVYDGTPIRVPVQGEFAAFVLIADAPGKGRD
jgi:hypothetical protein